MDRSGLCKTCTASACILLVAFSTFCIAEELALEIVEYVTQQIAPEVAGWMGRLAAGAEARSG